MRSGIRIAVTVGERSATSARTGLSGSTALVIGRYQFHNVGRCLALPEQSRHCLHRGPRMLEEKLQPRAEVILPGLTIPRHREAVFGAPTIANIADLASL